MAPFVRPHHAVDAAELRQWCRDRLAPYKVPRQVIVLPDLPRNSLGKVLKAPLAERLAPL